jgi:hypothetical protein
MIDLTKPMAFYDDRNKSDVDLLMTEILFKNEKTCVCKAVYVVRPKSQLAKDIKKAQKNGEQGNWWDVLEKEEAVVIDLETSEVMNKDLDSWYATNDLTVNGRYKDITKEPILNK